MADQGLPALTVVLTKLHAGGKFGGEGYKVSGGLHGVGVSVVNALSEWLVAEVRRDGKVYRQEFARGVPQRRHGDGRRADGRRRARRSASCPTPRSSRRRSSRSQTLVQRLRETAFLTRGLRIVLVDEREGEDRHEFHYEGGIRDFVAYVNDVEGRGAQAHRRSSRARASDGHVEVAMQWNTSYVESVFSFANNINTHEGGTHLSGFKAALTANAEPLRAREGTSEGEGGEPRGRGRPRGARRRHLGEAAPARSSRVRRRRSSATRRSRGSSSRPSTRGSPSSSRRTRPTRTRSSRRPSRHAARARRRARRAS